MKQKDYPATDQECLSMRGPFNQAYEPLGDLLIDHELGGEPTLYRRDLNLDTSIVRVSYSTEGVTYLREVFASVPNQVIAVHFTTAKPGRLNCTLRLMTQLSGDARAKGSTELRLTGKAPSKSLPNYVSSEQPVLYDDRAGKGMNFAAVLHVAYCDGHATTTSNNALKISGATTLDFVVSATIGYRGNGMPPDLPMEQVLDAAVSVVRKASKIYYASLRKAHRSDHRALFGRVRLDLDQFGNPSTAPIDEQVESLASNPDPALLALNFQMGHCLLISSSRSGIQPANLQGIWNADLLPLWNSNWISNINVQMNYWLAETCNLSECHLRLAEMVKDLSENGRIIARVNYGADGWALHHNIDLWRQSAPVGMGSRSPTWANFCMSGP
jgi:alpha-L-fucosidase 2